MADTKKAQDDPSGPGNVKLIGIAGLIKGEQFSITLGQSVVVGRSRDCDICMRDVPAAKAVVEKGGNLEDHFNTVSRKHVQITYLAPNKVEVKDLSSNGTFLDGKRIEGSTIIEDLVLHPHELKLGTIETVCIDWWKLVKRSEIPMVKVKSKAKGDEGAEDEGKKKETGKAKGAAPAKKDDKGKK
ncbi:MAG: FHA domain-containing protein [Planctomycetes bacterium]|nr:FHA domain-containing protein [Planctomycetota bacterium]NUQ35504.1 FHA domain-containing protein [Planctomycetaceae bacterium]